MMNQMDGYLDNLADASTTIEAVLKHIVDTNSKQQARIDSLSKEVKTLRAASGRSCGDRGRSAPLSSARDNLLFHAIENHWAVSNFCSTHFYGVGHVHTSALCQKQNTDHVATATRSNPAGPGSSINKGWDASYT
mmetsp:Transcript_27655/g.81298  ORF Transcript_27655/g.81298 Transcript_27655/m.81298 type:complete len:135 (+) Transcript_27655:1486-1890(+)